ncbi:MAG: HAD family phosphatase [Fulvivirga sp.]|nr:HAD family phosphatase [Fulvivirga sp.]
MIDNIDLSKIKGVIFDMDGTMVDNMMVHHRAWQNQLKKMGLSLSLEQVRQEIHGINEEILARLFGDELSNEQIKHYAGEKEAEYRRIFKPELKLIGGLEDYITSLKARGVKLAIGSAAPSENVDFVLDNLNLRHLFEVIMHAGDVQKGKPDPEIYQLIMNKLALKPQQCVIFEDSPTGAEAAVRSGAHTVVITTTHSQEEFSHLKEIQSFIKNYH